MNLNICTLMGLRYHSFSAHPQYPYKLFPRAQHSVRAVPHPAVRGGGGPSLPAPPALGTGASPLPPMVLQVLPLQGSSASIGYIYDATPDPEGGLLAAALAFFSHRSHQVFHDPCPDLAEYCQAMGVLLQSSPLTAFSIIFSCLGWSSWRACVPRLQPTSNSWVLCLWLHTSPQRPLAQFW